MTNTQLRAQVLEGGIKSVNFFNGRLLSAEDLGLEKNANKQARQQLGQAIGDGIAYGLEVKESIGQSTTQAPVVTVSAGLAVNREGQTLQLVPSVDVALVRLPGATGTAVSAVFVDCEPLQQGPYVVGKGVYLLTIQAASTTEGKAPVSGLGNLDAACNARYQIDGVQFRLIQLPITPTELSDIAHLRNHLAYRCFGLNDNTVTSFFANPFGPVVTKYGLLDELRSDCIQDNEVPLALIYWTSKNGIEFIDMWSVRRRVSQRSADSDWSLLTSDRRCAEGEAMLLQFQEQIGNLYYSGLPLASIAVQQGFRYLPPVGLLPIMGQGSPRGLDWQAFFGSLAPAYIDTMDAALLPPLIRESFKHQPFDIQDTTSGKLVLYFIRENVDAVKSGASSQGTIVFAKHAVAHSGMARFGYAVWGISRFA